MYKIIQLVNTLVGLPFLLFVLILPESPRWLFVKNRDNEGIKVSKLMARINKVELSDALWEDKVIYFTFPVKLTLIAKLIFLGGIRRNAQSYMVNKIHLFTFMLLRQQKNLNQLKNTRVSSCLSTSTLC